MEKYEAWLTQAKNDLLWAHDTRKSGHFAQACFIAQQVGEKSLKALAFFQGNDLVKSHSLVKISAELKINGEIAKAARKLDLYYISTRYPDALPDTGVPSDYFDNDTAFEAIELCDMILNRVEDEINR